MKNHKIASGLIWIILMIILPLPLVLILNTGLVDSTSNLIAYDFGIFAYVWWLADVYLATRPKWIANSIGLPSMYFIHGMLAVFAILQPQFIDLLPAATTQLLEIQVTLHGI